MVGMACFMPSVHASLRIAPIACCKGMLPLAACSSVSAVVCANLRSLSPLALVLVVFMTCLPFSYQTAYHVFFLNFILAIMLFWWCDFSGAHEFGKSAHEVPTRCPRKRPRIFTSFLKKNNKK